MVILARKDLKLSPGKLAAQVGHAAVDATLKAKRHQPDVFEEWLEGGQKKVVLKAAGLQELHEIKLVAEKAGLTTALIIDAGHTELPAGTTTVLAVGPGKETDVDRVTGHLALF